MTAPGTPSATITELVTLQFTWGGLFDCRPTDSLIHLVRRAATGGTPGPTLCGIDRFAPDGPGWSVGGGITGPGIEHVACEGCVETALCDFLALPVTGMQEHAAVIKKAIEVTS